SSSGASASSGSAATYVSLSPRSASSSRPGSSSPSPHATTHEKRSPDVRGKEPAFWQHPQASVGSLSGPLPGTGRQAALCSAHLRAEVGGVPVAELQGRRDQPGGVDRTSAGQ